MNHSSVTLWYGMGTNYSSSKKKRKGDNLPSERLQVIYTLEKENFRSNASGLHKWGNPQLTGGQRNCCRDICVWANAKQTNAPRRVTYDLPFKINDYHINKDGHKCSPSTTRRPETNKHKRTHQWRWSVNQKKIELILTFCLELPLTSALLPGPGPRTGAGRARGGARGIGAAALFLGCFVSVLIAGVQVILWQVSIFVLVIIVLKEGIRLMLWSVCLNKLSQ